MTNFVVLPLYFLSGVFIPQSEIPDGVLDFSNLFPIRHFFECFLTGYDPLTTGAGFEWGHLAILAALGRRRAADRAPVLPLDAERRVRP